MTRRRYAQDHTEYLRLLESTRDTNGVVHRDIAVKLLTEQLADDAARVAEFAGSRAAEVADVFDRTHKPITDSGQMTLDIDTYLIIGENERVGVGRAKSVHTRRWLDIQILDNARQNRAHAVKIERGYHLLAIQEEHECTMWEADRIANGETPS